MASSAASASGVHFPTVPHRLNTTPAFASSAYPFAPEGDPASGAGAVVNPIGNAGLPSNTNTPSGRIFTAAANPTDTANKNATVLIAPRTPHAAALTYRRYPAPYAPPTRTSARPARCAAPPVARDTKTAPAAPNRPPA